MYMVYTSLFFYKNKLLGGKKSMVSSQTLEVILRAKDQLSQTVDKVNQKLKQTGTTSKTAMDQTKNATNQATQSLKQQETVVNTVGQKYNNLKNTITNAFNSIKNTISNLKPNIDTKGITTPFSNAAESIKNKWKTLMQNLKGETQSLSNTKVGFNISTAGLMTLNGEVTTTNSKVTTLLTTLNKISPTLNTIGGKAVNSFNKLKTNIDNVKTKLGTLGSSMSMLSGTIMSAFGVVGVTSLSQFTIGAAIARQKLNAVTTSITGSKQATESLNKAISNATNGGIVGFTKVAQAVQQIGIKYQLSNKQLEATAPVLNKIGTLARAMGKDSETAATIMAKAYDGLNGNFMALQRNLGITKQNLLDAGWSGAATDVDGYTMALLVLQVRLWLYYH